MKDFAVLWLEVEMWDGGFVSLNPTPRLHQSSSRAHRAVSDHNRGTCATKLESTLRCLPADDLLPRRWSFYRPQATAHPSLCLARRPAGLARMVGTSESPS